MSLTPFTRLLLAAASAVVVLAGIRAAAPVINPVLIALLITIAWSPGSLWLRRRGWPPTVAALTGIVVGVAIVALIGILMWSSLAQLQDKLPEYQSRVSALRDSVTQLLARLPFDSSSLSSSEALQPGAIVERALSVVGGITSTAGNFGILVLIMAFMMIEAVRYPHKLYDATQLHDHQASHATDRSSDEDQNQDASSAHAAGLDDFVQSMRSYVVINTVFGLAAGIANTLLLWSLGVDFAILWGVLSFLLSFLPNIGFVLALIPPTLLALLQFGLARAAIVAIGLIIINMILDNFVKPRFLGESLDLSPAVVVLSLVFWSWLLGPVGALMAVPLSIAVKYLLASFHDVQWLAHLMSDKNARADHSGQT